MIDSQSETWCDIALWAEAALSEATERIEVFGIEAAETENLRGRIETLRAFLALRDEPKPPLVEASEGYRFQGPDDTG